MKRELIMAMALAVGIMSQALAAPGQDQEKPRTSGAMLLVRDWSYGAWGNEVVEEGRLDMDRGSFAGERRPPRVTACDRRLAKRFRVPDTWKGRPIWFTYNAVGLTKSAISEVWLNGAKLDIALPEKAEKFFIAPIGWDKDTADTQQPHWFAEISKHCRFGDDNTILFRVRQWPVFPNMGAWLYSPPETERVLFLVSEDVSPTESAAITRYAEHVKRLFPVDPFIIHKQFSKPEELRSFLRDVHEKKSIGGAVLIGTHPICTLELDKEEKALSHYYESLYGPEDKLRTMDVERIPIDIWTAWIRRLPEEEDTLTNYLQKVLDYYEKRLCFPDTGMIGRYIAVGEPGRGIFLYDALSRPADLTCYSAHGGTSFAGNGPHNTLTISDLRRDLYPAALGVRLYGCSAANIARPITPAEALLFGRTITQTVISHTTSHGGAAGTVPFGMYSELLKLCPHMGVMYQYFYDTRPKYPYNLIILGNPFVRVGLGLSAPSGEIAGGIELPANESCTGVYVSIQRDDAYMGRVRVPADGTFRFECLPEGRYKVLLHVNALQTETQEATVRAGETTIVRWRLDMIGRVRGRITDDKGKVPQAGWVEMASAANQQEFLANDLFGIVADGQGRFEFVGSKPLPCWIRAKSERVTGHAMNPQSPDLKVQLTPGKTVEDVVLKLQKAWEATPFKNRLIATRLKFEPSAGTDVPSEPALHPLTDVTEFRFLAVPDGNPTLLDKGRLPSDERLRQTGRAQHTLRLALELREPLPDLPTDPPVVFRLVATPFAQEMAVSGKPREDGPSVRFETELHRARNCWIADANVSAWPEMQFYVPKTEAVIAVGSWLFFDITPLKPAENLDWRMHIEVAVRREGRARRLDIVKRIPEEGDFHLKANLGTKPTISLEEMP